MTSFVFPKSELSCTSLNSLENGLQNTSDTFTFTILFILFYNQRGKNLHPNSTTILPHNSTTKEPDT